MPTSRPRARIAAVAALGCLCVLPTAGEAYQRPGSTVRVMGVGGAQPSDPLDVAIGLSTWQDALSDNGRYLAFASTATNLVPGDVNAGSDIFVYDRNTRKVELISQSSSGMHTAGPCVSSYNPSISADGRYVAFSSCAANLVPGDLNAASDVFVRDRLKHTTELVGLTYKGKQPMSPPGTSTIAPSISADGRYVAYLSKADDIVPGDTNKITDVFLIDRKTKKVERVSVSSTGGQATNAMGQGAQQPSVSRDGKFVAFADYASNLVPDDTNNAIDIFVRDVRHKKTERVRIAAGQGNNASGLAASGARGISADGRYVMVSSNSTSWVPNDSNGSFDIFRWDRITKRMQRVTLTSTAEQASGSSSPGAISADGRYVVVSSSANNLFPGGDTGNNGTDTIVVGQQPGDEDVFIYDTKFMTIEMLSVAPDGTEAKGLCTLPTDALSQGSGESFGPTVNADGSYVGFLSCANNLVPGDTNKTRDEYLRFRGPSVGTAAVTGRGGSSVTISGWSTFSGAMLAQAGDNGNDSKATDQLDGSEIVGGALMYRPEIGDLMLRIQVDQLPRLGVTLTGLTPPGDPRVLYAMRFVANGVTYEVRVHRAGLNTTDPLNAAMGLFQCTETLCAEVASLHGGYGTAGEEIDVAVPLSAITAGGKSLAEGGVLSSVRAFTSYGTYYGGAEQLMDDLTLTKSPSVALPRKSVTVVVRGRSFAASLTNGRFSASLPRSLFHGRTPVTVRSCLGSECRSVTEVVSV